MFGYHTPPPTKGAPPGNSSQPLALDKPTAPMAPGGVRKSIGEIESRGTSSISPTKQTVPPLAARRAAALSKAAEKPKTGAKMTTTTLSTKTPTTPPLTTGQNAPINAEPKSRREPAQPKKIFSSRKTEAKSWYHQALKKMEESGNLRRDIKATVYDALENMYRLVREAEDDRTKGEGSKDGERDGERDGEAKGKTGDKSPLEGEEGMRRMWEEQREKIKEHIEQMEKNRKEMERFKDTLKRTQERETEGNRKQTETCRELLQENRTEMEKLKAVIEKQVEERMTYASVAAGPARGKLIEGAAAHSMVVTSQDEQETGDQVLEKIREAVNAKESGVRVERVRKGKDRKIIIGCGTKEELGKVKERIIKSGKKLKVEEIKNKDPLVVLNDVLKYNMDEDIIKCIRQQNRDLFKGIKEEEDRMTVKYRKGARNHLTAHVVLQVSPQLWKRLVDSERIHIDLQKIKAEDQSPLVQCSRCLGYGHTKRLCTQEADLCSYCGGPHLGAECPERRSATAPRCVNCCAAGIEKADHSAFNDICPVRRRWDALARSAVQYC